MKEIDIEEYLKERGLVAILFHIKEVTSMYKLSDKEAYNILNEATSKECVPDLVYEVIHDLCEQYEYEEVYQ